MHGDYELLDAGEPKRRTGMNPKLNNIVASGVAFAGALLLYFGVTDEATWAKISGGLMTVISVAMPFFIGDKPAA